MRDYASVSPSFWTGITGRELRKLGPTCQVLALYLISCPHANMLGLYYLPLAYISVDTGIPLEGAMEGLARLSEAGFCKYDAPSEWVFVAKMAKYQVLSAGECLKDGDKRLIGVQRQYASLPNNPFLFDFYQIYGSAFRITEPRGLSPSIAPSIPLASQEQEQEQEQENNGAFFASPKSKRIPSGDHQLFIGWWDMAFTKVFDQRPRIDGKTVKLVKGMLSGVDNIKQLVCYASVVLTEENKFYDEAGRTLGVLSSQLEAFKSRKNNYDVALWREYGIAPPEGVMFEDWKFWEETDVDQP